MLDGDALDTADGRSMVALRAAQRTTGYPSPAEDFVEATLDVRDLLVKHPAATFFVQADSEAMRGAGIRPGDILVVDRALSPVAGAIVVATVDGELVVRRYRRDTAGTIWLQSAHADYPPLPHTRNAAALVWGVVTFLIRASLPGAMPCSPPSW